MVRPAGMGHGITLPPYTEFYVTSNGYVGFGPATDYDTYSNTCLPAAGVPNTIFAFWDDIVIHSNGGVIFYQTLGTAPNRKCVAQFTNMGFWSDPTLLGTFSIVLYETTNEIQIEYRILVDPRSARAHGNSATIGLNDRFGEVGVQYSCNGANAIASEQAIRFTPSGGSYTTDDAAVYDAILLGDALPPTIPALNSPPEGSSVCLQPTFQWGAADNTESYLHRISTSSTLSGSTDTNVGTATEYTPASALSEGTTYYWAVFANGNGNTTWSEIHQFIASSSAPPVASPQTVWTTLVSDHEIELQGTACGADLTATVTSLPANGTLYQYDAGARGAKIASVPTAVADSLMRVIYYVNDGTIGLNRGNFDFHVNLGGSPSADATVVVNVYPAPSVTTDTLSSIAPPTATCGGTVLADNGYAVTSRGVCWSTAPSPTIGGSHTEDGTGTGHFTSTLTGLTAPNTYYVRAYAVNEQGIAYGSQVTFALLPDPPTVTTGAISNVAITTADVAGNVTDDGGGTVTARGVCWSTSPSPTAANDTTWDGTGTGAFTSSLTGLTAGTIYYARAYATNSQGTSYGAERWFSTMGAYSTPLPTNDFDEDIVAEGSGTHQAEASTSLDLGCWILYAESFAGSHGAGPDGISDDRVVVSESDASIRYLLEPYDTNNAVVIRGEGESRTLDLVDPTSCRAVSVLAFGVGGNPSMTARVLFSDASYQDFPLTVLDWYGGANPAITDMGRVNRVYSLPDCGSDYDEFDAIYRDLRMYDYVLTLDEANRSKTVSGVRITKEDGVTWGGMVTGISGIMAPSTQAFSIVSSGVGGTQATLDWTRGNGSACAVFMKQTDTGNAAPVDVATYTANTVLGSGSEIASSGWYCVYNGAGTEVTVTGLTPGTTYRTTVCEYLGEPGKERYLTDGATDNPANVTTPAPPTVTTAAATLDGTTGFDAGGEVTDEGGASVTARGICWNATGNPTVADDKTTDGTGAGVFASDAAGLAEDTHYFFRAYATNGEGTSYGEQRTIITGSGREVGAYLWAERSPMGGGTAGWRSVGCSGDGTVRIAGVSCGRLYTSYDSGETWTERRPFGDSNGCYNGLAVSHDGSVMLVHTMGTPVYVSADSGKTWTEREPAGPGTHNWGPAAMSSDGAIMVSGCFADGGIYVSRDGGVSWTERDPGAGPSPVWYDIAISSDGRTIAAATYPGRVYLSADAGSTWSETRPAGDADRTWTSAAASTDGRTIYLGNEEGVLYRSQDGGANWIEKTPGGVLSPEWFGLAVSADGRKVMLGAKNGGLFFSTDYGNNWTITSPAGPGARFWTGVSLSSDGTRSTACYYDSGRLYVGIGGTVPSVISAAVSNIDMVSAESGGNVTSDGGLTLKARGVCWSTSPNPTVASDTTLDGVDLGAFTSELDGLTPNTRYYTRAYAVNALGASYGAESDFRTGGALLTVGAAPTSKSLVADFTTIQEAIDHGETTTGDTIQVDDSVHTEAGISVTKNVVIRGHGADSTIVQAAETEGTASNRVFGIGPATVLMRDMTIRHGRLAGAGGGLKNGGNLTMERCVIRDNITTGGGNNEGGGLLSMGGKIALYDCTIMDNVSEAGGGGMTLVDSAIVWKCAITGNEAAWGGGVVLSSEHQNLVNCTISGNTAASSGGGVVMYWNTGAMTNCTVTDNTVTGTGAGGIYDGSGVLTLTSSIVAGNHGETNDDVSGTFVTGGYNLIGDNDGSVASFPAGLPNGNHDWVGSAASPIGALLETLADNGGPTETHELLYGSPARNKIPAGTNGMGTDPLDVDQRGEARPALGDGDIGAVETQRTLAAVQTSPVTVITPWGATAAGEVTDDGGATVTARGICYGPSANPTVAGSHTTNGSGTGTFSAVLSGLSPKTTYHVRAYGTNSEGTNYGGDVEFTTVGQPEVVTAPINVYDIESAEVGGEVTDENGGHVTAYGVCWDTLPEPTVADESTTLGSGTGAFQTTITGLEPNTTYYVRAFATNAAGTSYGGNKTFATPAALPEVTTAGVQSIGSTTAEAGGEVTDDGRRRGDLRRRGDDHGPRRMLRLRGEPDGGRRPHGGRGGRGRLHERAHRPRPERVVLRPGVRDERSGHGVRR